jgi:hypothetical protein
MGVGFLTHAEELVAHAYIISTPRGPPAFPVETASYLPAEQDGKPVAGTGRLRLHSSR